MIRSHCLVPLGFLVGACATPSAPARLPRDPAPVAEFAAPSPTPARAQGSSTRGGFTWVDGQPLMHGFLGLSQFSSVEAGDGDIDGDAGDLDELPLIGGGAQWRLGGRRFDLGLEGLLSFSGRANAAAFVSTGGGAALAVDVDLLLFQVFGGPFASLFLGDRLRLYGGAGPLLQFADYDQTGNGLADSGSGFGYGWYARTGVEYALKSRNLVGLGVRWSDTSVDLGSSLDDLEIDGLELVLTVSRGL